MVSVADPGGREHDDAREGEGRRDEALRGADVETHALAEDDGEEICDGVCGCCQAAALTLAWHDLMMEEVLFDGGRRTKRSWRTPRSLDPRRAAGNASR